MTNDGGDSGDDTARLARTGRRCELEPRAMTLRDWLFIVVGVAVAWTLPSPFQISPLMTPGPWLIWLLVLRAALSPGFIVTSVVLGRQVHYARGVYPAEWSSVVLVGMHLSAVVPNVDDTIVRAIVWLSTLFPWEISYSWTLQRWMLAGACCALLLAGLVSFSIWRRRIHPSIGTALVVLGVAIAFWGPLQVLSIERPWPLEIVYFSPAPFSTLFHLALRDVCLQIPAGLMIAVPALAAARGWRQDRRWVWTEWVSAGTLLLLLAWMLMQIVAGMYQSTWEYITATLIAGALFLVVEWFLSWLILGFSADVRRDLPGGQGG